MVCERIKCNAQQWIEKCAIVENTPERRPPSVVKCEGAIVGKCPVAACYAQGLRETCEQSLRLVRLRRGKFHFPSIESHQGAGGSGSLLRSSGCSTATGEGRRESKALYPTRIRTRERKIAMLKRRGKIRPVGTKRGKIAPVRTKRGKAPPITGKLRERAEPNSRGIGPPIFAASCLSREVGGHQSGDRARVISKGFSGRHCCFSVLSQRTPESCNSGYESQTGSNVNLIQQQSNLVIRHYS